MKNFRIFIEKEDKWIALGIFSANTGGDAIDLALKSRAILDFYSNEELNYVNLEFQEME